MILFKANLPIAGREDVWASVVSVKTLSPARRDKLVTLLNLVGFVLKNKDGSVLTGEVVKDGESYLMENGT